MANKNTVSEFFFWQVVLIINTLFVLPRYCFEYLAIRIKHFFFLHILCYKCILKFIDNQQQSELGKHNLTGNVQQPWSQMATKCQNLYKVLNHLRVYEISHLNKKTNKSGNSIHHENFGWLNTGVFFLDTYMLYYAFYSISFHA